MAGRCKWKFCGSVYDDDGNVNRQYYEMAVLTELRNLVRSGNVSIKGSRQHQDFDNYLVTKETWEQNKHLNELSAPPSVDEYLADKMDSLHNRLKWIKANITELDGVNFEDGRLHVHRLEKNVPETAREHSLSLYKLIPRVKLTDLLMEVASWTGFEKQLLHASTLHPPKEEEKPAIMAAIDFHSSPQPESVRNDHEYLQCWLTWLKNKFEKLRKIDEYLFP